MKKNQIEISIPIPEGVSLDAGTLSQKYMKEVLIGMLYAQGKLTAHEACLILNQSKREFIQMLQQNSIPIGGYTTEEDELENRSLYQSR